jgi:hypothetical protein
MKVLREEVSSSGRVTLTPALFALSIASMAVVLRADAAQLNFAEVQLTVLPVWEQ